MIMSFVIVECNSKNHFIYNAEEEVIKMFEMIKRDNLPGNWQLRINGRIAGRFVGKSEETYGN